MQGKPVEGLSRMEVMRVQQESAKTTRTKSARISTNLYLWSIAVQRETTNRWTVGSGQQGKPMEGLRKEVMRVQEENEKEKVEKCSRKE